MHPRCGTNILGYIVLAAVLDPLVGWWGYAILQFILISEAWFVLGKTPAFHLRRQLRRGTSQPPRSCARRLRGRRPVLNKLLQAEEERAAGEISSRLPPVRRRGSSSCARRFANHPLLS